MNERIRQLVDEATELDYETFDQYNHKTVKHYKFDKEKFAQLIVRDIHAYVDGMDTAQVISNGILRRYGMEE